MTDTGRTMGSSLLERLPLATRRRWLAYGFAIAASLAAVLLRWEIDDALPPGFPFLTFFPAVILTAFLFGLGPGVFAGVLCGLTAWYAFIPPAGFAISYSSAVALAFYVVIVTVDIALVHWMQRANGFLARERERADTLAQTRETLFQELQHRVGNNLQMVASLLSLQARGMTDPGALTALGDASRRLALVGRIQRTLYSADGEQRPLAPYIETIVRDTIAAAGRDDIALTLRNRVSTAWVRPEAAIPTALVVAEAVSNAIEHGLAERGGTITLTIDQDESFFTLRVEDDGVGLPEGFATMKTDTLGLRIARSLAESLGGGFELSRASNGAGNGTGAVATIRIARRDGEK